MCLLVDFGVVFFVLSGVGLCDSVCVVVCPCSWLCLWCFGGCVLAAVVVVVR